MKESTKLILMGAGAAVASNILLGDRVAAMTSGYAMPAAGVEGLGAAAGGYFAWKKKSKAGALIGGALAGLLVSSIQGGLMSPPAAAKPAGGSTPQSTQVQGQPKSAGAALPTPAVGQGPGTVPLLPQQTTTLPGFSSASGQLPPGAAIPKPNRPPTAQETQAYADYMAQELQNQQVAMAQQAAALQQGGLPTVQPDTTQGGDYFPSDESDQSGAVIRLGMAKPKRGGFGGAGGSFRRGYGSY